MTQKWTVLMEALCGDGMNAAEKQAALQAVTDDDVSSDMLADCAAFLLERALPLDLDGIDVCGTGGDKSKASIKTFNISTAAAFVVAAGGISAVKHGNRAVSSASGSSDVLAALGIPVCQTANEAMSQRTAHGLCFVSAPAFHPALAALAPVRRAIGRPTFLNLLGPLCNPARTQRQLFGVYDLRFLPYMMEAAKRLGKTDVIGVHSDDGLDEISVSAATHVFHLRDGKISYSLFNPEDTGIEKSPIESLAGGNAEKNADIIEDIFSKKTPGPPADIVCLNAAAAFVAAGKDETIQSGLDRARTLLNDKQPLSLLAAMRKNP